MDEQTQVDRAVALTEALLVATRRWAEGLPEAEPATHREVVQATASLATIAIMKRVDALEAQVEKLRQQK